MNSFFTEVSVICCRRRCRRRLRYNLISVSIPSKDERSDNNKSSHEHIKTGGIFLGNKLM